MARQLTVMQRKFAEALPAARSATEAAIIAGYPPGHQAESRASENVRKREIMSVVEQKLATAAEEAGVDVVYVLKGLKENKERSMRAVPVLDHEGKPTGEYQYDGAVANRSMELIGKHLRMFGDDKPPPQGDTYNQVVLQGFTFEQLQELLGKMTAPKALPEPQRIKNTAPKRKKAKG